MPHRKPVVEIKEDAGEKPGFGRTQQKAQGDKTDRAADQGHRPRQEPPGDHDAGHPKARDDPLENEIARHLEEAITAVKGAGAEPEEKGAEPRSLFIVNAAKPTFTRSR